MNKFGVDFKTYITEYADNIIEEAEAMMGLNYEETFEYDELLEKFKKVNSSSATTKEKGEILEKIVSFILNKSVVFEVYENARTSTNEIDLLVRLNSRGIYFTKNGLLQFEPNFLCECKNYNQKVDVTWVGKFYSLVKISKNNLGILFSFNGFSGKDWNHATGLGKKILLTDNTKIVDFNIEDFEKISHGYSFIKIINDKIFNLEQDTKINQFVTEHPNTEQIKDLII